MAGLDMRFFFKGRFSQSEPDGAGHAQRLDTQAESVYSNQRRSGQNVNVENENKKADCFKDEKLTGARVAGAGIGIRVYI